MNNVQVKIFHIAKKIIRHQHSNKIVGDDFLSDFLKVSNVHHFKSFVAFITYFLVVRIICFVVIKLILNLYYFAHRNYGFERQKYLINQSSHHESLSVVN